MARRGIPALKFGQGKSHRAYLIFYRTRICLDRLVENRHRDRIAALVDLDKIIDRHIRNRKPLPFKYLRWLRAERHKPAHRPKQIHPSPDDLIRYLAVKTMTGIGYSLRFACELVGKQLGTEPAAVRDSWYRVRRYRSVRRK
jgi:hypothetical protein